MQFLSDSKLSGTKVDALGPALNKIIFCKMHGINP